MKLYIGLDVDCKETVYVSQDEYGNVVGQGSVTTSPEGFAKMLDSLGAAPRTEIALETGALVPWVCSLLTGLKMTPVVIEAREVRQKARRLNQKSDRRDAFEICDGLRRGVYTSIVYVPDPKILRLRRILSRRCHFVKISSTQVTAAKALLRARGLGQEVTSLQSRSAWERMLQHSSLRPSRRHIAMHAEMWRLARENVDHLEEELTKALRPFEETMSLLQTTPGVGLITAATFIAVLGTPERFSDSGRVVSYIGLVPSSWDTGEQQRHGHITKRGSAELRRVLCEAAHHASRVRHPLNLYFRRVCATQGYKKAAVAIAQRLARILYRMWLSGEAFDANKLNVVAGKRVCRRVMHWRIRKPGEQVIAA
jgi:transposase